MVKIEKASSAEESGNESDFPQTPLAASTQKSPRKEEYDDERSEDEESENQSEHDQSASQEMDSAIPKRVKDTLEKYLNKFPHVRISKEKYSVDVDLTDSDDEVWIVRCPAAIDAKKVLMNAKLDACQLGEASKIHSLETDKRLEGSVVKNSIQKPITILSGTNFKSFVHAGTIQIRETSDAFLNRSVVKQEGRKTKNADDEVPFPEHIRERHPLLGLNYKSALKLPKRTKKALSLAAQRADAWYLQKGNGSEVKPDPEEPNSPKKKRKRKFTEIPTDCSTEEMIRMLIKQEPGSSPSKKKAKKEPVVEEDDLSWLQNI